MPCETGVVPARLKDAKRGGIAQVVETQGGKGQWRDIDRGTTRREQAD